MELKKTRKTDRRTLYTRMVIKDALLSLLSEKEYADITIADLCREAEISRGTFYLHYDNLSNVMDALFDDALGSVSSVLVQVGCEAAEEKKCAYPLCRFLRENKKYRPLFFSDSLHSHAIERIAASSWENFYGKLSAESGANEDVLRAIFYFQLNGCLAVSKQNIGISDSDWSEIQCSIDHFLKNGFSNLQRPDRQVHPVNGK